MGAGFSLDLGFRILALDLRLDLAPDLDLDQPISSALGQDLSACEKTLYIWYGGGR